MRKIHPAARWLDKFCQRVDIGRDGDIYLQRWFLMGGPHHRTFGRRYMVHRFLRSDWDEALHDHPWPFTSLIVAGGYWEWTPVANSQVRLRHWYGPGSVLRRPAEWKHRVELPDGKECWTIVWTGQKVRSWGFWCPSGFVHWREFLKRVEASESGCGE